MNQDQESKDEDIQDQESKEQDTQEEMMTNSQNRRWRWRLSRSSKRIPNSIRTRKWRMGRRNEYNSS